MSDFLTRTFHDFRDEEAAKADGARQAKKLDDGCMYTYCPSQISSLTQHPSDFPASAVERNKIFGLSHEENHTSAEFYLPPLVSTLIQKKAISVQLFPATDLWFDLTHPANLPHVKKSLENVFKKIYILTSTRNSF